MKEFTITFFHKFFKRHLTLNAMLEILFSPKWFYGKDILIDIFSIIVLSLIATFSIKYYKMNKKNKNYFWFGISFITLALSFLFKILTNFTIYYNVIDTEKLGLLTLSYNTIRSSDILFSIGFLSYILLTLLSFLMLYEIYKAKHSKQNILLTLYFIITITYFTTSKYFIFHLTAFLFLFLITLNYFKNYLKNKKTTSKFLVLSFAIIALSQLFFIFVELNNLLYVFAESIQFIGYLLLLITFMGAIKNAKKK